MDSFQDLHTNHFGLTVSRIDHVTLRKTSITIIVFIAAGLSLITSKSTALAMQVSESNPMAGIDGRASLLFNLASALVDSPEYFGQDGRPGNIVGDALMVLCMVLGLT